MPSRGHLRRLAGLLRRLIGHLRRLTGHLRRLTDSEVFLVSDVAAFSGYVFLRFFLGHKFVDDDEPNARTQPRRANDVNRECGTEAANRRWLQ